MKSKIKLFYILLISILLISPTPVKAYDDWGGWDDWDYYDDWDDWDDWDNDSWYDDDPYDWGAGSDDVYVYPDDNDEPYDWGLDDDWWRDAYVYDDDDDYNSWDWEEDYNDRQSNGNSSNDDSTSDNDPGWQSQLEKLIRELSETLSENAVVFVDLDGDGIYDGYVFIDADGVIHYRDFGGNEVIIEGNRIYNDPDPLPIDKNDLFEFPRDNDRDSSPKDKAVPPSDDDDCNPVSAAEVKKLIDDLDKVKDVEEALTLLRKFSKTNSEDEMGIMITDKQTVKFYQGKGGNVNIPNDADAYIDVHVHTINGYNAPSPADIRYVLLHGSFRINRNYQGSMIIAPDGSEYFIYIDDRDKVRKANTSLWHIDKKGYFLDEEMNKREQIYYESLIAQGYSDDQAFEYAMAQLIKDYAPGLKLYRKSDKGEDFKQMVPEKDENDKITPQICK